MVHACGIILCAMSAFSLLLVTFAETIDFHIHVYDAVSESTVAYLEDKLRQNDSRNKTFSMQRISGSTFRRTKDHFITTDLHVTKCSRCDLMKSIRNHVLCVVDGFENIVRTCSDVEAEDKAMWSLIASLRFTDLFIIGDKGMALDAMTLYSIHVNNILHVDMFIDDMNSLLDVMNESYRGSISHFFVSVTSKNLERVLRQVSRFGPDFNWLFDLRYDFDGVMEDALGNVLEDGDSVAVVSRSGLSRAHLNKGSLLEVKKCFGSCRGNSRLTTVALVSADGYVDVIEDIFPPVFNGFHMRRFRVVTKEYAPFVKRTGQADDGTVKYGGLCIYILDLLADSLNFTYDLYEVPDGLFGVEDERGRWNGMIGEVHDGKADFAVNGITITSGREMVVDFTFPFWEEPTAVLISHFANETRLFSLLKPLHWVVWVAAVANKMPFDSIEAMVEQTEYSYGVERGIVQHMLFQEAESGIYRDIWKGIKTDQDNLVSSIAEGVNKTLSEMYAFIGEKAALKVAINERCDISFIEEEFFKSGFGFAMPEKWPYTKYFNDIIMRLVETGYVENWKRNEAPREVCSWEGKSLQAEPISLDGVSGSFILLALGLVIAGVGLCYERIEQRCCPHFALTSLAQQFVPHNSIILLWRPSAFPSPTAQVELPAVDETPPVDELNNSVAEANVDIKNRDQNFHRNVPVRRVRRMKKVMNTARTKYQLNDINISTHGIG
ncbi:hypothetical protein CAPTEDRAFT_192796 [Capitella teleta]|uniref:Ionotropic glutamate receptor L-glutamate and glycine-binding domain-containing protein n=1 Tax=Capitella teleta TaxID=283909 RepID=R7VDX0_CAPTE|nr:hypothetical protein CAPTEDRAFT_192796 [Capitella teleta]|eukprot:ELU14506.1 hypothetical protein CAPTEDRAFT_192796 [Capitella teleta]